MIFTFWLFYSYQSRGVDNRLLKSDDKITVAETADFYSFTSDAATKQVLIFYPGAMVETEAYVPLCRKLSENRIKVYLIKMPWRLASRGYKLPIALNLFADTTKTYILAGHSQGAKMAAQFVHENPDLIHRLVLIGTTHPRDISLADSPIPVLKIYGSRDGVAPERSVLENRSKLPESTKWVRIEGAPCTVYLLWLSIGRSPSGYQQRDSAGRNLKKHIGIYKRIKAMTCPFMCHQEAGSGSSYDSFILDF